MLTGKASEITILFILGCYYIFDNRPFCDLKKTFSYLSLHAEFENYILNFNTVHVISIYTESKNK